MTTNDLFFTAESKKFHSSAAINAAAAVESDTQGLTAIQFIRKCNDFFV
jgi:hypothetical protein